MRFIIAGVGAIGGAVAATLTIAGHEVIGIARGTQLEALKRGGLTFRTPDRDENVRFSCVASAEEIDFRPDDIVLLATKTQDTWPMLCSLRDAGVQHQHVFCVQNGVENERLAARIFGHVHGVTVMLPAEIVAPGFVAAFGSPRHGIFESGRYPSGADEYDRLFCDALGPGGIVAEPDPDVMSGKYGKLIVNLGNIVEAAMGRDAKADDLRELLRAEGKAVLDGCGIPWRDVGQNDPRRSRYLQMKAVEGVTRAGSSTSQSLLRETGSVETDFLNGEIVLLARMNGLTAPANEWFCTLAARMVRDALKPGALCRDDIVPALAERGVAI